MDSPNPRIYFPSLESDIARVKKGWVPGDTCQKSSAAFVYNGCTAAVKVVKHDLFFLPTVQKTVQSSRSRLQVGQVRYTRQASKMSLRVLVGCKRCIDYAVKIRHGGGTSDFGGIIGQIEKKIVIRSRVCIFGAADSHLLKASSSIFCSRGNACTCRLVFCARVYSTSPKHR